MLAFSLSAAKELVCFSHFYNFQGKFCVRWGERGSGEDTKEVRNGEQSRNKGPMWPQAGGCNVL